MTHPNPVRSLESNGVVDQTAEGFPGCEPDGHYMRSIKTNSELVPYVEQCATCLWVDGASLNWWGHNIMKNALADRAARIAVAVESEPFAFVQSSVEELELSEVLLQALGAASTSWVKGSLPPVSSFDGARAQAILAALVREVDRFQRLALEDAATRAVEYLNSHNAHTSYEAFLSAVRRAVEGRQA